MRLHTPAVYRVATLVVGQGMARDLVEDAFAAAWRQLPRLRDRGGFGPWLHRIVVNRGHSILRRGGGVREVPVSAFHETTLAGPHGQVDPRTARAVLAGALASLSYDQRALIALHHAAGLSLHEVAEAMDVPVGTATSRLEASLDALRRRAGLDPGRRASGAGVPGADAGGRAGAEAEWRRVRPAADDGPASDHGSAATRGTAADDGRPARESPLDAFLASLGEVPVPSDLAASSSARVRGHPTRRPSLRLPLLAAAAGLLVVVSGTLLAGWQPPIDILPGPGPTGSVPSRAATEGAPSTGPMASRGERAPDFARLVTAGAELRTEPGAGLRIATAGPEDVGAVVLVLGRTEGGGRGWTRVEWQAADGSLAFAWLEETVPSSGPTGYRVPVLERMGYLPCPSPDDVSPEQLASLGPPLRLACLGRASFSVGPVRLKAAIGPSRDDGSPAWLTGPAPFVATGTDATGSGQAGPIPVRPQPGLVLPEDAWIRLTGHLDDPAAAACERRETSPEVPVGDPAEQVLWCRQQLVITGWEEAGG